MTFVHVGTFTELANGKVLTGFGEEVQLSQSEGEQLAVNDVPLLPADLFGKAGFTAAELEAYPNVNMHELGGPVIAAKRKAAWLLLHDYREALKHPAPAFHGEKEGND